MVTARRTSAAYSAVRGAGRLWAMPWRRFAPQGPARSRLRKSAHDSSRAISVSLSSRMYRPG
ncbi:hypothetical protein DMB66_19760 [Actinoplanes sp. ATCC 53533]|nr:hypothetical protein DMB66_19760 [Actinoplanes sp. ATCC 53533]